MIKINSVEKKFLKFAEDNIGKDDIIHYVGSGTSKLTKKIWVSKFFKGFITYTPDFIAHINNKDWWFETKSNKRGYCIKVKGKVKFVPIDIYRVKMKMKLVKEYCYENQIEFRMVINKGDVWYDITDKWFEKVIEKNKILNFCV